MKKKIENKMSLQEYEKKFSSKFSDSSLKHLTNILLAIIGFGLFVCLFFIFKEAYEFNKYVGYGAGVLLLILYVFLFIIPLIKIKGKPQFKTDITQYNILNNKRHNAKLRNELAEQIIDLYKSSEGSSFYSDDKVDKLDKAVSSKNKEDIKNILSDIYKSDIKKAASNIIIKSSTKSAAFAALSQSSMLDAALVSATNIQLIKDLVYLYGFRPNESNMFKIVTRVLNGALLSYGIGEAQMGGVIVKSIGGSLDKIPVLGPILSTALDSTIQGLADGLITALIGYKTISYLNKEFNLQNILEDVEVDINEQDFGVICEDVKRSITSNSKNKSKIA